MSNDDHRPFQPDWTVHPGEIVEDYINELGWTETYLALRLGWTTDDVKALLAGRVRILPATAQILSVVFGSSPQFWTNLQTHYDRECVRLGQTNRTESVH